jgi:hypothetical protein
VTFPKADTPPVDGSWLLTVYDAQHFFSPKELGRYSLGTKKKIHDDGSLTIYVQPTSPGKYLETNWLPAPAGAFSLYLGRTGRRLKLLTVAGRRHRLGDNEDGIRLDRW